MKSDRYGFIMVPEAELVDWILNDLKERFGSIRFLEIGVFGGGTVTGICRQAEKIGCPILAAGVDFEQWKPNPVPIPTYLFFGGDSMDMWRKIDLQFNFLFVDGCHCVNHAMCDFLNYSPFVVEGGYALFHDTDKQSGHDNQGGWPQDHSYAGKPDSVIGVRDALKKIGLLDGLRRDWQFIKEVPNRDDGTAGMMLFKKTM